MSGEDTELRTDAVQKLTDWAKEPELINLKADLELAKESQGTQIARIDHWNNLLQVKGSVRPKKIKGRSSVQPKLIRRQAEWRYSALTEPFLGSHKLYKISPSTFEDAHAAKQNEMLLNYQWRMKFNRVKFIDDFVRATTDEGTSIIRVGWERTTTKVDEEVPVWSYFEIEDEEELQILQQALELKTADPRTYNEQAPEEVKAAIDYFEETGQSVSAQQTGTKMVKVEKVLENRPTAEILNPKNVYIDPTCGGVIEKALFAVISFETCKADLLAQGKRYKNLDKINWEGASVLNEPDHETTNPNSRTLKGVRKRVVAYEYWGFYDVNGDDKLVPFVATWIGDTLIRMELNPFPDGKLPLILVPYLPVKREIYGEPDAELLEDNQAIVGALSRGMIDLVGRTANGQRGIAKGMLDPLNRRRYDEGKDYEFNPNVNPQHGMMEHKYPELPRSALELTQIQNAEAEAITGVKSFSGGMSGEAYGDVAAGIKGVLDAAAKREMSILRRLAKGITEMGTKFISMNGAFLSEEEVIRITNTEFVTIKKEELAGNFDLEVDISTAEVDNAKSQDLAFMLQTMGPSEDPGMRKMVLSQIADLKRMPELANNIRTYKPEPDPVQIKIQELTIAKLEAEIEDIRAKTELSKAKAKEAKSAADLKDLDFVEQESGTKHERDLEKMEGQAEGNKELEVTKALLKPRKPEEKAPDIEAAVGFNEMTKPGRKRRQAAPAVPLTLQQPETELDPSLMVPEVDPLTNPGLI